MSAGPKNARALQLLEERDKTAKDRVEEASQRAYAEVMRATAPLPDSPQNLREWGRLPDSRERVRRGDAWHLLAWYHHEVVRPMLKRYHEHVIEPQLTERRSFLARLLGMAPNLPTLEELDRAWVSPWEQLYRKEELEAQKAAAAAGEKQADLEIARLEKLTGG